jgi:DNA-binding NarL/FixJ family response regulator
MSNPIRVIVVDDHEIFRNGLKMVIGKIDFAMVVGEASNGEEFLNLIKVTPADIVLMDVEMPFLNGIEATRLALKEYPYLKIIALTMFAEDQYIQSMLDEGAKGFLIKNIKKEALSNALMTVHGGGNYYSEELFRFFTKQLTKDENNEISIKFTRREKEILQLLAEGLNNKEIAEILFVSERTVIGHKSNMLGKTGCKSTVSLLSYAIKHKVVMV